MGFKGTIHFTHTGYYAGAPFCGCAKDVENNTFMHVPYSGVDRLLQNPALCPICKKMWEDAADEDED